MLTESEKHQLEEAIRWFDGLEDKPELIQYGEELPIMELDRLEYIVYSWEEGPVPYHLTRRLRSLLMNIWLGYSCEIPTIEDCDVDRI